MLCCRVEDLKTYLETFRWDGAKYNAQRTSVAALSDLIVKQVSTIENAMKIKQSSYNTLKGTLLSIERKATYARVERAKEGMWLAKMVLIACVCSLCRGNLLVKSLDSIVSRDDFLQDSEYLVTQLVVVPR